MKLMEFRRQRIEQAMEDADIDILIATMPSNISYLTGGYVSIMQAAMQQAECAVGYVRSSGELFYVISYSELPTVYEFAGTSATVFVHGGGFCFEKNSAGASEQEERAADMKNHAYPDTPSAFEAAVRAFGQPGDRIGIDEGRMFPSLFISIQKILFSYQVCVANPVFREARKIKHPDEIAGIRAAAEAAEESLMALLHSFEEGMTEYEMHLIYDHELTKRKASPCYGVITSGKRTAYSDTVPDRKRPIRQGDILRFDFGCMLDGYAADLARTAFVGKPDQKTEEYYEAVRQGCHAAMERTRAGAVCCDVFSTAVDTVRRAGISHYRRHHCGHGIGLEMYDLPGIRPDSTDVLQENMVLCIETPYYELGWGGVQLEHTVAVTADGIRQLDHTGDGLILL